LIWFEVDTAFNYDWQDWRINVLGRVPGAVMDLLNAIEQKFWSRSDKWECSDLVLAACFLQKTLILQVSDAFCFCSPRDFCIDVFMWGEMERVFDDLID
jgi:hypothetical protein